MSHESCRGLVITYSFWMLIRAPRPLEMLGYPSTPAAPSTTIDQTHLLHIHKHTPITLCLVKSRRLTKYLKFLPILVETFHHKQIYAVYGAFGGVYADGYHVGVFVMEAIGVTRVIGGLWENTFRSAGDSNVCPVTLTHATVETSLGH